MGTVHDLANRKLEREGIVNRKVGRGRLGIGKGKVGR